MNVWRSNTTKISVKRLSNGKRMDGIYTLTLALNTESVATLVTTYSLKKADKTKSGKEPSTISDITTAIKGNV